MIKIFDNVLDLEKQNALEEFALTRIPWYYYQDISGCNIQSDNPNYFPSGGFSHVAFRDGIINSSFYKDFINLEKITHDIFNSLKIEINEILRLKLNLTTPIPGYKPNNFCTPHVDLPFSHYVLLYYINNSDGDTIFFKTSDTSHNTNFEILTRIRPKKGSCVLFDGSIFHTQSNPIVSPIRLNLNINVTLKNYKLL